MKNVTSYALCLMLGTVSLVGCLEKGVSMADLMQRMETLQAQVADSKKQAAEMKAQMTRINKAREADFEGLDVSKKVLDSVADEIRMEMQRFAEYKGEYRKVIRAKSSSMNLGELQIGSQKIYDAVVTDVTNGGVTVRHRAGTLRIAFAEAPLEVQDLFGYDPELDTLVERSKGTGAEWLANAIDASSTSDSSGGAVSSGSSRAGAVAAADADCVTCERPKWTRFSNFTGSFWRPMQNRNR
jgi:hypothetical protein